LKNQPEMYPTEMYPTEMYPTEMYPIENGISQKIVSNREFVKRKMNRWVEKF